MSATSNAVCLVVGTVAALAGVGIYYLHAILSAPKAERIPYSHFAPPR